MLLIVEFVRAAEMPPPVEWQRSFGGSGGENCRKIVSTSDGGFLLSGGSNSGVSGNKTSVAYGEGDWWLVKVAANGNKLWERSFGGSGDDGFLAPAVETADGGFLLGGRSSSGVSGNKTSANYGDYDYWIIKIDAVGNKLWERSIGGSGSDVLTALVSTSDGGFLLGGISSSGVSGTKTSANYGDRDFWLVKVDAIGSQLWDRSFGGSGREGADDIFAPPWSIVPSGDGGFVMGGQSSSGVSGNKTSANYGGSDYWLFKVDADGNKVWEQSFGGNNADYLNSIAPADDGGFLLGGTSYSGISGNKASPAYGLRDFWLVKVDANGNKLWDKTLGGDGEENLASIASTSDGGFVLGGYRVCYPLCGNFDFWLVKVDARANELWQRTFGGSGFDELNSVVVASDGAIVLGGPSSSGISGNKTSPNYGDRDFWARFSAARWEKG
jgi:hypothetical protein